MVCSAPLPTCPSTEDGAFNPAPFAVLFDSDGVLVDSERISLIAFRQTTEECIGGELPEDEIEAACGLRDSDIVMRLRRRFGVEVEVDAYSARKGVLYREQAARETVKAFPGVIELLENLRAERIPYALASSGPLWKIEFNLGQAQIRDYFDVVVSGETVARGKPEPDVFLEAARRLKAAPERCVVIEDSINGVQAARAGHMACLAVTNTFDQYLLRQADRIVDTLEGLHAEDLGRLVFDRVQSQGTPPPDAVVHPKPSIMIQTLS